MAAKHKQGDSLGDYVMPMRNREVSDTLESAGACLGIGDSIVRARDVIRRLLPANSLRCRFARGAAWVMMGSVISQGLGLLASMVRARLLGQTGFGELGTIQTTMGMLGVFAGMGLGMTVTKHVAEFRFRDPARAGRIIGMSSAVAVFSGFGFALLGLLASSPLARSALNAPHLAWELRLGCGLLFFNTLAGAQSGVLAGLEAFRTLAAIHVCAGLLNITSGLVGPFLWGLPGAVGGLTLAAALGWLFNVCALRRVLGQAGIPVSWRPQRSELAILWQFSLPALFSQALFVPAPFILNAMLVHQPGGYSELGVFNAAQSWIQLVLFLPTIVSQVSLPMLSNLWSEGRTRQYVRLLLANVALMAAMALMVALPVAAASRWIMPLYGASFAGGSLTLALVCVYGVLWAMLIPLGQAIWSAGAVWLGVLLAFVRLALLVAFFQLFIGLGAVGLALAYTAAYVVQLCYLAAVLAWRSHDYRKQEGWEASPPVAAKVVESP